MTTDKQSSTGIIRKLRTVDGEFAAYAMMQGPLFTATPTPFGRRYCDFVERWYVSWYAIILVEIME